MAKTRRNPHDGSSFDSFLEEYGLLARAEARAVKAVVAWQLAREMKARKLSKLRMAKQLKTSRTQVNRILDPTNDAVTLETLNQAAHVLGKRIHLALVDS